MRPIGFSTGALAYADFRAALRMMDQKELQTVQLSALRQAELVPLFEAIPSLDLSGFEYVSIHAPSQFDANWEAASCELIAAEVERLSPKCWPIVLHPDSITDFGLWRELGASICIENMDKRKTCRRKPRSCIPLRMPVEIVIMLAGPIFRQLCKLIRWNALHVVEDTALSTALINYDIGKDAKDWKMAQSGRQEVSRLTDLVDKVEQAVQKRLHYQEA